jgi:hypothetical protein
MTGYKIQITNNSGDQASYFLVCDIPSVSGLNSDAVIWSTVLLSKIAVQANDIAIMNVPASAFKTYVVCGSSPDTPLATGLSLELNEASPMTFSGSHGTSSASQIFHVTFQDDGVVFSKPATASGAPDMWCTIQTEAYTYSAASQQHPPFKSSFISSSSPQAYPLLSP